ncbi:hypothetical protein BCR44DRAFT_1441731 [Catenaria anguillulae PL171]|uniref:SH3 domain-containing protein n=1 Tax=Catenaria anguillulae PL171 TaxID=765915 RepID=A0A1Y2HB09_9FUNG|nr:hypothetical protein BCR44DRAFT_1441731 [Catenaria anguillulae PL171]
MKVPRLRRRGRLSPRQASAPGQCVSADANESGFGFCGWETRDAACANDCRAPGLDCGSRGGGRVVDSPPSSPTPTSRASALPISGTPPSASASATTSTTSTPDPQSSAGPPEAATTSIVAGEAVQAPPGPTGAPKSDTSDGDNSSDEEERKKIQAQADSAVRSQRMVSTGIGVGASVIVVSMAVGALVYVRRRRESKKERKMDPSQFANLDPALGPKETKRRMSIEEGNDGNGNAPGAGLPYMPPPALVQQPDRPLNTFNNIPPASTTREPIVYNDPVYPPPPMYATDPRPPSLGYPTRRDSVSASSEPSYVPPPMTFTSSFPNSMGTPPMLPPIAATSELSSMASTLGAGLKRNSRGGASVRSTGTNFVRPERTSVPSGMDLASAPSSGTPTGYAAVGVERFEPEMNDEMAIDVGERINVVTEYLDGWAAGFGADGKKGVFPLACVERV